MATETTKIPFIEGAAAATPAANRVVIYAKADGKMYSKDDVGAELLMSVGATGGTTSNFPCQGRLTLTTGVPITTADVTAATTLYFTPYLGNQIATYSGTAWSLSAFTEKSITLATLTADLPYDCFIVDSTLALELTAWTNATTRATALVLQDGVYVKSGATTRRYLGTICITNTTGQCEDSLLKRLVWNYYNRVERKFKVVEATNSWTYSTNTWRAWNNSTANRVQMVIGVSEDLIGLQFNGYTTNSGGNIPGIGIGLDVTNANNADVFVGVGATLFVLSSAAYSGYPGIGSHFLQLMEIGAAAGTTQFAGDNGVTYAQAGALGIVRA